MRHTIGRLAGALVALALAALPGAALAASAHNSQAGAYGQSQNPTDSTPSSPRVKHAAKHRAAHRGM